MIIEIKDFPLNVSKITLEFGDSGETRVETISNSDSSVSNLSTKSVSKTDTEFDRPIDFSGLESNQVSQEVVEKPKIPKRDSKEIKVAQSMQNLEL